MNSGIELAKWVTMLTVSLMELSFMHKTLKSDSTHLYLVRAPLCFEPIIISTDLEGKFLVKLNTIDLLIDWMTNFGFASQFVRTRS